MRFAVFLFGAVALVLSLGPPQPAKAGFTTLAEMIEVRASASEADRETATAFLTGANDAAARGNWSAAAKGYRESALFWPSGPALLGSATAFANISRDADGCENGYRVKLSDLSRALNALVLLHHLGQSDGKIYAAAVARDAIATAQRDVFAKINACTTD